MNKIGIFSIRDPFSTALLKKINSMKKDGIKAEAPVVGETRLFEKMPYRVIIDRITAHIAYFKPYFENAALTGTYVINNPFSLSGIARFNNYDHARRLGLAIPRTVCLPTREYNPACAPGDLSNLKYPLPWEEIGDFIGFPAILKPYHGYGYRDIFKVNNVSELIECYNGTGRQVMIMQEFIEYDFYVKTFVVGAKHTHTLKFNPAKREYVDDDSSLKDLPIKKIIKDSLKISKRLGVDFNTVEFAVKDGVLYAINFLNPHPACREGNMTEECYEWCIDTLAEVAVQRAESDAVNKCDLKLL